MTPVFRIKPRDRQSGWIVIDCREDEDFPCVVVLPTFGPDHHGGADCWCQPTVQGDGDVFVHNAQN